jgi:hypothetical protein
MPPSRRIKLTEEEDNQLRQIEQSAHLREKVRLRAQVLHLSHRGSNIGEIASYTGRSRASVARDLDRWVERGLEGLVSWFFEDGQSRHVGLTSTAFSWKEGWEEMGLRLYRLPAYCPHLITSSRGRGAGSRASSCPGASTTR